MRILAPSAGVGGVPRRQDPGRYDPRIVIETRAPAPARRPSTWLARLTGAAERHPGRTIAAATFFVGLPLLVAVVALRGAEWYPVLDLAMTEYRVRDVFGAHTPLIGLPGRIGTFPNQGSHPGPLSFYLLAPTYRALGASSWALEAATVAIHLAAMATALWIGHRRLGWRGIAVVGALLALVVRGYGQVPLTQPWNPYLPLLAWIVVLLAAWAVLCGEHVMVVPLVVAASYCAQTHVPYLGLGVGMVVLGMAAVAWQARRASSAERRARVRSVVWALAIGAVLWLPPVADQLTNEPGNLRRLADHFGSPPEAALGISESLRLALRHLDVWSGLAGQLTGTGAFVDTTSQWRGAVTLLVWAVAAAVAWRHGPPALRALHVVVGAGLLLGFVSMARIFGRPWFYLTLWAWGVTALLAGAVLWSAVVWLRRVWPDRDLGTGVAYAGGLVAVVVSVLTAAAFVDAEHPEERLSAAVGALAGPTYDAVVGAVGEATGADGRYLVRWSDAADIGSPGYGLLDELERRGLDVAADTNFRVQVTDHRTSRRSATDAQIHLATGSYIDTWRSVPGAVEVATYDPRTDAERAEYEEVRSAFIARLTAEGLDDLVAQIETNLFGMSTDPRLGAADHADLGRLIELGQPMAVFIAPPPADDDPNAP